MKSLRESLIFELNSSTYASAHDKEVARNGKETNRSRRFAVAAGKALTAELKKKGLIDSKTGKIKDDKRAEALPIIVAVQSKPEIQAAIQKDENSIGYLQKHSGKTIKIDIPAYLYMHNHKCKYYKKQLIEVPNVKYLLYHDKYHDEMHLATLSDMIDSMSNFLDDYEGFGPKDIVYSSNNAIDVVKYAVEHYGSFDENGKVKTTGTYDHPRWAQDVIDGTAAFDDFEGYGIFDIMSTYVEALVDDNGYVYGARLGVGNDHTEKYQDYIKRVESEENK